MNKLQEIAAGLQIIAKYGDRHDVGAEHDVIMAGHIAAEKMTEEDKKAMEDAGWSWSDEYDSYTVFV